MATYMGRDTSKLKNKGGKWKYVIPPHIPTHNPQALSSHRKVPFSVCAFNHDSASAQLRPLKKSNTHMIAIQQKLHPSNFPTTDT
jgi:hypothetical protein